MSDNHDINAAIHLATQRGYLPLRPDTRWLQVEPEWLADLQRLDGFDRLQNLLGQTIPSTVRQFWRHASLVRLLDSWRWQDYLAEPPQLVSWNNKPHLAICTHPHSGGIGAVAVDEGDDPPLHWGFEDDDAPFEQRTVTMTDHVYLSVKQGPDDNL